MRFRLDQMMFATALTVLSSTALGGETEEQVAQESEIYTKVVFSDPLAAADAYADYEYYASVEILVPEEPGTSPVIDADSYTCGGDASCTCTCPGAPFCTCWASCSYTQGGCHTLIEVASGCDDPTYSVTYCENGVSASAKAWSLWD